MSPDAFAIGSPGAGVHPEHSAAPSGQQTAVTHAGASAKGGGAGKRILIVYDCLYPWSIGGAERWYRALGERLAAEGHRVSYATLRQWQPGQDPAIPGVRVVTVGPRLELYSGSRRRLWPPLRFGCGVLLHLLRHGREYDVVHLASFPYWPLLAAALVRRRDRHRLIVDWWEVWTRAYWQAYAGPLAGTAGWLVQRRCIGLTQRAFCFSQLHARRLQRAGMRGAPTLLRGIYDGPSEPARLVEHAQPLVLYAGRHIPEKRVPAIVPAVAEARKTLPDLRAVITGDGPDRSRVVQLIATAGLDAVIELPGFVSEERLDELMRQTLCLILPSRREGYGLVVVEAAARGTPSIVVRDPDNAATELIEEGVNGFVAASASAPDLASAILRVDAAGPALRRSTADWFARNARRLSLTGSLDQVLAAYRD